MLWCLFGWQAVFVISLRLWLWLRWTGEHKTEVKKPVKFCKAKKKGKLSKKNRETNNKACKVFALCSAFCNVNLHCGDRTYHFAWHLRHLEDRPFQVAWYLQDFANDICSICELQPSTLQNGDFPFWFIFEAKKQRSKIAVKPKNRESKSKKTEKQKNQKKQHSRREESYKQLNSKRCPK